MMTGIDEIQICRVIRADGKHKNVLILFLTGKSKDNDNILCLETCADDYNCNSLIIKELYAFLLIMRT